MIILLFFLASLSTDKSNSKKEMQHHQNRVENWFRPTFVKKQSPIKPNTLHKFLNDSQDETSSSSSSSSRSSSSSSESSEDDENLYEMDKNINSDCNQEEPHRMKSHLNEKKLSTIELNKRFMHNYLNTIGKLFTKVGMETYQEVCSHMLHEFNELLRRQPCALGKMRLLQINIINLALIDLISKSQSHQLNQNLQQRSQLSESSIQLDILFSLFIYLSNYW